MEAKMSDHDQWLITTDGSYSVGGTLTGLQYHQKLNLLFVVSKSDGVLVYDTTSSTLLKNTDVSASDKSQVSCRYISEKDGLLIGDGNFVTVRKDLNGMYLLDTALQGKIGNSSDDLIKLELTLTDAEILVKGVESADMLKVDKMDEIIEGLKQSIAEAHSQCQDNQKKSKMQNRQVSLLLQWCTVTMEYPQNIILYVFQHIMTQLKLKSDASLAMPIAAAITERSGYYATDYNIDNPVPLDRALMYSEAARLATFENWPHKHYQWAKPESMSRAGFYHDPTSSNDDRSMCFTCNVCLVCWETTDEPWSEHERHQPGCPFIKGLPTQNVPMSVYHASQPSLACKHKILSTSTYGEDVYLAALMPNQQLVKIFKMNKQLDLCRELILTESGGGDNLGSPMSESSPPAVPELIAMCLISGENDDCSLSMVTASLSNQMLEMACYDTGCVVPTSLADIEGQLQSTLSSAEQLAEAIYLEKQYLVTEPPGDKKQKGVVVPAKPKLLHRIDIPKDCRHPCYTITYMEQSLDKQLLLVNFTHNNLDGIPSSRVAGALATYKLELRNGMTTVFRRPYSIKYIQSVEDTVVHVNQLSQEFSSTREIEGSEDPDDDEEELYHMMITKRSGAISLMQVHGLKDVTSFSSSSHRFTISEYCSGIDRVCAATTDGDIVLLQVSPETPAYMTALEDVLDGPMDPASVKCKADIEALFDAPFSVRDMKTLSDLTECENLSGKYTATLGPCWTEVHQDQLQRKHPQHLQRYGRMTPGSPPDGTAILSTRTWKLQPDNDTAMREHVVELSLPRVTSVGHVDLKFTIQGRAKAIPDIKVALLGYKMDNRRRHGKGPALSAPKNDTSFLPQTFLDKHKLQLLSAPVSLALAGDVSGLSGFVTLTSPALLKIKPRSLVIYMKMSGEEPDAASSSNTKPSENSPQKVGSMLFPQVRAATTPEKPGIPTTNVMGRTSTPRSSSPSTKNSDRFSKQSKGMDLIDEISISVRKTKTTNIAHEKLTRSAMLDSVELHQNLVEVAYKGHLVTNPESPAESALLATEQNRISAMKVLAWIAVLQANDVKPRKYEKSVLGVIEDNLNHLIEDCIIRGTRSTSHALTRLLTVSTELSRRLGGEESLSRFSKCLLDALLTNLELLKESQSSGAVHSYFLLMSRVKCLDVNTVCRKVSERLHTLSELYYQSFTEPDMHRLSSYGLTSSPYDTEVFEASLPSFVSKNLLYSSTSPMTLTSQEKQHLTSKEETLPMVDLTKSSCQGFTNAEHLDLRVTGLLEVEPLQFSINSYSEYIHVTHGSNPNITPVFYGTGSTNAPDPATLTAGLPINVPQTVGSIQAKLGAIVNDISNSLPTIKSTDSKGIKCAKLEAVKSTMKNLSSDYASFVQSKILKSYPSLLSMQPIMPGPAATTSGMTSTTSTPPPAPIKTSGNSKTETGNSLSTAPYPNIQAILQPPNEFTLIAGRMSSGNARRFIVLDFGQPIRLTDVVIPACADMASLAIDVWLERELLDSQRLVVCTDITNKCLVLTDIQPACVCQFLKITYAPRTSGTGQTYRIPLGVFYGHAYVFPWETESHVVALRTAEEVRRQICVYNSAVEDIRCCYKLACGRLQTLMQTAESQGVDIEHEDYDLTTQIQQTHEECLKLQQQLNLATNAIRRLRGVLPAACATDANQSQSSAPCRDKLRCIIEGLISVLLSSKEGGIPTDLYQSIPASTCKQLFSNLCVHGSHKVQLLTGNLLVQVCSGQAWYGRFFEQVLTEMFSSANSYKFPKLRVFGLLVSMAHRSLTTSRKAAHRVCANVMQLLSNQLAPLTDTNASGFVDMGLVSWLLLFLSRITDCNFDMEDPLLTSRWDFLSSESTISKRKLYYRYPARQKARQERAGLATRHKLSASKASGSHLPTLISKNRDRIIKKHLMMRNEKEMMKLNKMDLDPWHEGKLRRRAMNMTEAEFLGFDGPGAHTPEPRKVSVVLDKAVILPVVRGLMSLILKANFSCHTDMFILACKVLARLSNCARPTLRLGEVATREQLRKLMYNITHSKYNSRTESWAGDWGKHAVGCLFGEIIEGERANLDIYDNAEDPEDEVSASSAQGGSGEEASTSGSSLRTTDPYIYMLGEGAGRMSGVSAAALGVPPISEAGSTGMKPMDLLRMLQRDEMEEMMDMDMEMDMFYGAGAEMADFMENMPFMREMELGPRPPISSLINSGGPPMVNTVVSPVSCTIDSRLKYCFEAGAELRLQLWLTHELSDRQKALSYKIPPSHSGVVPSADFSLDGSGRRSTSRTSAAAGVTTASLAMEDTAYSQSGNDAVGTDGFVGEVLSELICTERDDLDLQSILSLYLDLNEEFREASHKEGFDACSRPYISLSTEAIEALVNCVAVAGNLTTKVWTQLLRVLTVLLNSNLNDDDRVFALRLCGSETFHQLLSRYLSSCSSVGPQSVKAFEDMLGRIQVVYQAANDNTRSLSDMLMNTLSRTIAESCARKTLGGALDAQHALIEFIGKLPANSHSNSSVLPLFEHAINLTKFIIDSQDRMVILGDDNAELDVTSCFQSISKTARKDDESEYPSAPTKNQLIGSLLKLLSNLLSSGAPPTPISTQQPQTDSSKLSRGGDQNNSESMDTNDNGSGSQGPQTDEQKRTAEGEAAMKYRCLHVLDVDVPPTLADSLLSNRPLVSTLIQCLAACRLSCPTAKPTKCPVTIGDRVFQLLAIIFRTSKDYYQMLVLLQEHLSSGRLITLSDPLRLFITLTLNCEHTITRFIELSGISCITSRLAESYAAYPDNTSGMISSVLQHLTTIFSVRTAPPPTLSLPSLMVQSSTGSETLMNFAPLGNIYSSIPSVGPMYSLIQASQTHRRARTAPWSHKFTPEQPWIDITITLPCAVLLKEIQIHPYLNSLHSAGPSLVSIELSHDGLPTLPSRRPVVTSGHTSIKLRLLDAEIVTTVTIRIHKPVDSTSVGLTQICVLGYPGLPESCTLNHQANSRLSWLQLLYHCVNHVPHMSESVIEAVHDEYQVLHTCCSLLLSNKNSTVSTQLEKVITELALRSVDMSKSAIDVLLRQNHRELVLESPESMATEATAEILYRICLHRDNHSSTRVGQMLKWLEDCAVHATATGSNSAADPGVVRPSRLHVQCVAATVWKAAHLSLFDMPTLFSLQFFRHLFNWSLSLSKDMAMKQAVNNVIAAICQIDLKYFLNVLQNFFTTPVPASNQTEILRASVTDDTKDDIQHEMLTDERKGDCRFKQDSLTDRNKLTLLAAASQSDNCAQSLIDSSLPRVLSQAVTEFCLREIEQPHVASPSTPRRQANPVVVTWKTLPTVLNFFRECSSANPILKDWMGGTEGQVFWALLLELFCGNRNNRSGEDQSVESSVVSFFKTATLNHTINQLTFSEVMCNLLRVLTSVRNSAAGSTSLSSFMKNLLLQTMLEDEKIHLTISSHGVNYRFDGSTSSTRLGMGVGRSTHTLLVSIHDTMEQVAEALSKQDKKKNPQSIKKSVKSDPDPMAMPSMYDLDVLGDSLGNVDYDDVLYATMSSMAQASKDKRKGNKKTVSSTSQTDHGKMKGAMRKVQFVQPKLSDEALDGSVTVAELVVALTERGLHQGSELIELDIYKGQQRNSVTGDNVPGYKLHLETSSTLKVFTGLGGLALLADHLPLLYPEITQYNKPLSTNQQSENGGDLSDQDYEFVTQVKGISLGGMPQYEAITVGGADKKEQTKKAMSSTTIPPHSLVAFGLFLRLPGYAEMLIKQRLPAKFILRLVLGVRDDGEGTPILASSEATALPTLPFTNLKRLYQSSPLTTDDGLLLRRISMDIGVLHLVLACLAALSHHSPRKSPEPGSQHDQLTQTATFMATQVIGTKKSKSPATAPTSVAANAPGKKDDQLGQTYWAKGTGFGTGSTTTQWDLEQLLLKQQGEEEHVTCMLDIISAMIHPEDRREVSFHSQTSLPMGLFERLSDSCLLPAIASYLRNDSVLDMSRHVPLYQSVYRMLRALASSEELVPLLTQSVSQSDSSSLEHLNTSMAKCVATYKSRLGPVSGSSDKSRSGEKSKGLEKTSSEDEDQANSLNELAVVLSETQSMLTLSIQQCKEKLAASSPVKTGTMSASTEATEKPVQSYESIFKDLQFDAYQFIDHSSSVVKFLCHHHYEVSVRQASSTSGSNSRTRRLAQEAVTLSTSLPLSASSSVFVRCDEERMDVMKVLITGPCDTPYMNGCFEFDVFFPTDYPTSPPLINLQTTGNHKVRFNPNLYNDGKVCLSVLNTWHGRPEEKWNAQTSSFLQVLVSIQSLILVNEPYFNEPGYERSRGTPAGTANCREYDSNIRQATVKYGMLEMLKNPPPCFKEIIHKHFWLKRKEIKEQIEAWLADQEVPVASTAAQATSKGPPKMKSQQTIAHHTMLLRKHYQQLMLELQRMKTPEGLDDQSFDLSTNPSSASSAVAMEVESSSSISPGVNAASTSAVKEAIDANISAVMEAAASVSSLPLPLLPEMYSGSPSMGDWPVLQDISCLSSSSTDMDIDDPMMSTQHDQYDDNNDQGASSGMFL